MKVGIVRAGLAIQCEASPAKKNNENTLIAAKERGLWIYESFFIYRFIYNLTDGKADNSHSF